MANFGKSRPRFDISTLVSHETFAYSDRCFGIFRALAKNLAVIFAKLAVICWRLFCQAGAYFLTRFWELGG